MPDFPLTRPLNAGVLSTLTLGGLGVPLRAIAATLNASIAWPVANLAIYEPSIIYQPLTIVKMSILNGTAVSGNVDIGIYDAGGAKLVTAGSTAQAGTSAIQTFDITDTLLRPGLYYMALALDNTTGTVEGVSGLTAIDAEILGVMQQASAFAMPSPATFAAFAQTLLPFIAMHTQGTI